MEYIVIVAIVLICMPVIYKLGKLDGKHEEREHLLDVFESMSLKDLSPETRYSVLLVTRTIITKLREGWK
jgi:hypothetical protein